MTLAFAAVNSPDLNASWDWFEFQSEMLAAARSRALHGHAPAGPAPFEQRLLGLTPEEAAPFFEAQKRHLDLLCMLDLLTTTEAILRVDFWKRVEQKKKDPLSRRYRELSRRKRSLRLDDDILEALKDAGVRPQSISDFRGALKLRHWLAHGRYWHPRLGRDSAPHEIWEMARPPLAAIPPA